MNTVPSQLTVYDMPKDITLAEVKARICDAPKRRHLSWGMDFDSRAMTLAQKVEDTWSPEQQEMHSRNLESARRGLIAEFGEWDIDRKVADFIAIDTKPMSVLAYHNQFFEQIRKAFVLGSYYPALVGACALGERILNHMVLDMRPFFAHTPEHELVAKQGAFSKWALPIDTLVAWDIMLPKAAEEFRALMPLRHRSIHFNAGIYARLRDDALAAILHMRAIIDTQFGSFGRQPWFMPGTTGHLFIKKDYETHPFVTTYYLSRCPFVGPLFGMAYGQGGWDFFDIPDYGDGAWTDEEFAREFMERDPEKVAKGPPVDPA